MSKINYPSGLKRRVSGDWNCTHCNNLNFAFRFSCNKCKAEKPEEPQSLFHSALFFSLEDLNRKEGLEDCFGFLNEPISAKPLTELSLNTGPKIVKDGLVLRDKTQVEKIMSQVKRPDSRRTGDWVCLVCNNLNFAFRKNCNKCRHKKEVYIDL